MRIIMQLEHGNSKIFVIDIYTYCNELYEISLMSVIYFKHVRI
jgi:hypothetical protein